MIDSVGRSAGRQPFNSSITGRANRDVIDTDSSSFSPICMQNWDWARTQNEGSIGIWNPKASQFWVKLGLHCRASEIGPRFPTLSNWGFKSSGPSCCISTEFCVGVATDPSLCATSSMEYCGLPSQNGTQPTLLLKKRSVDGFSHQHNQSIPKLQRRRHYKSKNKQCSSVFKYECPNP